MGTDFSMFASVCQAAKKCASFDAAAANIDDAKNLPMEDGIWIIAIVDSTNDNGNETATLGENILWRFMAMVDERGKLVGASAKDSSVTDLHNQAQDLYKQCLFAPLTWKPRRPRYLGFRNDDFFTELPLEEAGIQKISMFSGALGPDILPAELEQRRTCTTCHARGVPALFELCNYCKTVYYCSKDCLFTDFSHPNDVHGHIDWCAKMKNYNSLSEHLAALSFKFVKDTTDVNFHDRRLKQFLADHGVLNQGFWKWEYFEDEMPSFGELPLEANSVVLPVESVILESPPADGPIPAMENWGDYYEWRGFHEDSPIAILMQWPLTVYCILKHHAPKKYPEIQQALEKKETFTIHIVGVEKEADLVPLFWELGYLFPKINFNIVMIGNLISPKVNGKEQQGNRVKVTMVRTLYHKYEGPKPDLVIGFNAGLAAYSNWVDALRKLKMENLPVYFTDYCQYSVDCANFPIEGLGVGKMTKPAVNPFRSPIRKYCEEHQMPWYSNAFIFGIEYG
ncbi:hypothetical protein LSH36_210g04069 [Paralvinella palmiformis]|uniref:MYND-type domain-containing protein n=1 Tax=Paralvinella palmiformis TaxID=53620 RepID=A0AAD9JNN5_9ANNE|nr:hypothetical protein LSH36_210g04069 [Paralvinella palmiformis]